MTNQLSTERYREAMALHAQIMASGSMAARALVEFSRLLKRMKDERLYEAFDQTFDEYVENQVGIKKRQAYTYIAAFERLGAPMMEQNASLGITKLELLSQVSPIEREDVLENYNLGDMSSSEVKKLVDDLTNKGEQLTFALQENKQLKEELEKASVWVEQKKAEAGISEEDATRIAELEKMLEQAEKKIEKKVADAVRQTKVDAAKEQAKAVKEAVAEERRKAEEKAAGDLEKAKKEAADAAAKEAEERAKIQYEQADRNNEELRAEIETLKKKMSIAGNQDAAIVSAYCKTVLAKVLNELVQMISDAKGRDAEQGAKLAKAAAGMLGSAQAQIAGMAEG